MRYLGNQMGLNKFANDTVFLLLMFFLGTFLAKIEANNRLGHLGLVKLVSMILWKKKNCMRYLEAGGSKHMLRVLISGISWCGRSVN